MQRREFLQFGLAAASAMPLMAAMQQNHFHTAANVLGKSVADGEVSAAALYVRHGQQTFGQTFGASKKIDDIFLLASISKPMSIAALMTLYDDGEFGLDDPVQKFIPEFAGDRRDEITIRQLLTHVSGLPDQLPENQALRKRHATQAEFIERALRTPLLFEPGSEYRYSSMGILIATEIAHRISGINFLKFIDQSLFQPLDMKRSALGLGPFKLDDLIQCQVEDAARESGSGDTSARDWDWNSLYWRSFGAPWGGAHASAPDVARFLAEFLHPTGKALKPETARLMIQNHNRPEFTPRGLGFEVGPGAGSPACSPQTFGHSGSTGTLAWADPATDTICVVLTTLPSRAAQPHPRQVTSDRVAEAVQR